MNVKANNDTSEGMFATMSDILIRGGRIDIGGATAIASSRYNNDMGRGLLPVSGRKSKKTDKEPPEIGLFHELPEKLQNSLLSYAKKADSQAAP